MIPPATANIIGLVIAAILGLLIIGGLYWSYTTELSFFIAALGGLLSVYSIQNIVLLSVMKPSLKPWVYKVYVGSSIFFAILGIMIAILFIMMGTKTKEALPLQVPVQPAISVNDIVEELPKKIIGGKKRVRFT